MSILQLPENTAHTLRATLSLNDATSVVKELIDNALDANATSIIVDLSANTLTTIQVKDNGSGIGLEDRQLLCKSGCTSKIRNLEDLASLGGRYLGFRGEALASITHLCESINVRTRVDGEISGTSLTFDSTGRLLSSSSTPHPTGTTLRVNNFLNSIPVRRSSALKSAGKTLSTIKDLMFHYSFARPAVRFQLRVLKSENIAKTNWNSIPCKDNESLIAVAASIVGKDIASQCQIIKQPINDEHGTMTVALLRPDAVIQKCKGINVFVSVDGRPLRTERGLFKDLHKIYKTHLQTHLCNSPQQAHAQFLLIQLEAKPGSYDVNIEPAKDQVLFHDPTELISIFEDICEKAYGYAPKQSGTPAGEQLVAFQDHQTLNFQDLLARKPSHSSSALNVAHPDLSARNSPVPSTSSPADVMRDLDTAPVDPHESRPTNKLESADPSRHTLGPESDRDDDLSAFDIMNPFVLAKMNAKIPPRTSEQQRMARVSSVSPDQNSFTMTSSQTHNTESDDAASSPRLSTYVGALPSPGPSPDRGLPYQNPGPPNRPWKSREHIPKSSDEPNCVNAALPDPLPNSSGRLRPKLLDQWTKQTTLIPARTSPGEVRKEQNVHDTVSEQADHTLPALPSRSSSYLSAPGNMSKASTRAFRVPFKQISASDSQNGVVKSHRESASPVTAVSSSIMGNSPSRAINVNEDIANDELRDIMDFEHRKQAILTQFRKESARRHKTAPARNAHELNVSEIAVSPSDEIPAQTISSAYTQNRRHDNSLKVEIRSPQPAMQVESRSSLAPRADIDGSRNTHTGAYNAEHPNDGDKDCMSPYDPRAYLIRSCRSEGAGSGSKAYGASSTKLPFEQIPVRHAVRHLTMVLAGGDELSLGSLREYTGHVKHTDGYIMTGEVYNPLAEIDEHKLANAVEAVQNILQEQMNRSLT